MQLFYWSIKGIVEPLRMFQSYFNIQAQEISPNNKKQWDQAKQTYHEKGLDFPNLPFIIYRDKNQKNGSDLYLSETKAIAEYLNQNQQKTKIQNQEDDILYEMIYENLEKLRRNIFRFLSHQEFKNEKFQELLDDYNEKMSDIQKLKMENTYILSNITYLDFQFYYINSCMEKLTNKLQVDNPIQKYQKLNNQYKNMHNSSGIQNYLENDLRSSFSLMSKNKSFINLDDLQQLMYI